MTDEDAKILSKHFYYKSVFETQRSELVKDEDEPKLKLLMPKELIFEKKPKYENVIKELIKLYNCSTENAKNICKWWEIKQRHKNYIIKTQAFIENYIILGKQLMDYMNTGDLITTTAAYYNNIPALHIFLNANLDFNAEDSRGYTPLHIAIMMGHHEFVKELLNHRLRLYKFMGYDIELSKKIQGGIELTPLTLTAPNADHVMLDTLIQYGSPNLINDDSNYGNALHILLNSDLEDFDKKIKYVQKAMAHGIDITSKNNENENIIVRAARLNEFWIVEAILHQFIEFGKTIENEEISFPSWYQNLDYTVKDEIKDNIRKYDHYTFYEEEKRKSSLNKRQASTLISEEYSEFNETQGHILSERYSEFNESQGRILSERYSEFHEFTGGDQLSPICELETLENEANNIEKRTPKLDGDGFTEAQKKNRAIIIHKELLENNNITEELNIGDIRNLLDAWDLSKEHAKKKMKKKENTSFIKDSLEFITCFKFCLILHESGFDVANTKYTLGGMPDVPLIDFADMGVNNDIEHPTMIQEIQIKETIIVNENDEKIITNEDNENLITNGENLKENEGENFNFDNFQFNVGEPMEMVLWDCFSEWDSEDFDGGREEKIAFCRFLKENTTSKEEEEEEEI